MNKKILVKALWVITAVWMISAVACIDAFAWGGGPGRSHGRERAVIPPRHKVVLFGGARYHYYGGRFYRGTLFGLTIVRPPVGIIIDLLPAESKVVFIGGIRYYCYDNVYYEDCPAGYIVVPAPAANTVNASSPQPSVLAAASGETVEVNVPNSNGSYTAVKLTKSSNGYIGPQGEFYPGHPTVEQLKVLYGS